MPPAEEPLTSPRTAHRRLPIAVGDAVIDGELVAIGKDGVSHFQLLQSALRHDAKLLYCAFNLMFQNAVDLRKQPLLERKKRLKAILPRDRLIAFSPHRKANGTNSCQSEDEAATTWAMPSLVAEVKFTE